MSAATKEVSIVDRTDDLSRRTVLKKSLAGVAAMATGPILARARSEQNRLLRLGGPVFEKYQDPQGWIDALRRLGYHAAYCPIGVNAGDDEVRAYEEAAEKAGIPIAEVGAWSNPISRDKPTREAALETCRTHLALADRIGARCCVNIAGSLGDTWDGPAAKNFTQDAFDLIVETTRSIIDAVKPRRTYYALETMPWAYPDSPDCYLRLLKAIDRPGFAVHLDPVNLVCSPQRYYGNAELIRECFEKLGPHIRSCHAKDILLQTKLTTHLDEARPGQGGLDYAVFLKELSRYPGTPLMLEHLSSAEEYRQAAEYVRGVAKGLGVFDLS